MFSYYNPQYCPSTSEDSFFFLPQRGQPPAAVQAERVKVSRSTAPLLKCRASAGEKKKGPYFSHALASLRHILPFSGQSILCSQILRIVFVLSPIP